eukprot:scaffold22607_cov123-Cylindrotheca_fusiformis.AAC.10
MCQTTDESSSAARKKSFSTKVEDFIGGGFYWLGANYVGAKPKLMIILCFVLTIIMAGPGFAMWETENRQEELWVPQDTQAEEETEQYESFFPRNARFNTMIVQSASNGKNVLNKASLEEAMNLHMKIENKTVEVEGEEYSLTDVCAPGGGCVSGSNNPVCSCLIQSVLKYWNYDLPTLQNDTDVIGTINQYAKAEKNGLENLKGALGNPVFANSGDLVSAEAFSMSYFLKNRAVVVDGQNEDPIGEAWEEEAFLAAAESVPQEYPLLEVDYFATRSFSDEFGDEISSDVMLVQISYVVSFLYLGANLGAFKCGTGSRWTMAFSGVMVVALSTAAGFGLSSIVGLFFGPIHSILPFILLGIGVDDGFVIANAFNRERTVARKDESNDDIALRAGRAMARAGASITVTSATDLVAFAISSSSSLPALASFCGYAAICIFFLWLFASVFFSATFVLDERRQRDNRRECLCWMTRKGDVEEDEDSGFKEGGLSTFFRQYHAPTILSTIGKLVVVLCFAGLLAFGIWGAMNLSVEDSQRDFIPEGSYLTDYFEAADDYFPSTGIDLAIVFEGGDDIYRYRQNLADLDSRLSGKATQPPYIAEPATSQSYKNVMDGLAIYLNASGSAAIGNVPLGDDNWPTTQEDFVTTLKNYTSFGSPGGGDYARSVSFSDDGTAVNAIKIDAAYVRLTKEMGGEVIDDADKQIDAMDETRDMVSGWEDLPERFVYSPKFIAVEGFKTIQKELFLNVGLAIAAVGVIVFLTVGSVVTSLLITINVAMCIIEILGFMYVLDIVIDSVSVINMVLAVGLSVDYSAHIGHSFMTKRGDDKNERTTDALADMGSAVLSGAISTFLAVVVLLFSSSYVFVVLSTQFALTVGLGIIHGLILLPVMLSVLGPKAHDSPEEPAENPKKTVHEETMDSNDEDVVNT